VADGFLGPSCPHRIRPQQNRDGKAMPSDRDLLTPFDPVNPVKDLRQDRPRFAHTQPRLYIIVHHSTFPARANRWRTNHLRGTTRTPHNGECPGQRPGHSSVEVLVAYSHTLTRT
jgi:hypothetical protein